MLSIAFLFAFSPVVFGQTGTETFYPPLLNYTSYITNASIGTYGGVYNAQTANSTTPAPYGTYDYCFMPHPRIQEYKLPELIANGSIKADLIFVEYIQRHQRRTAYNILPGGENQAYFCDNVYPYVYASPQAGEPGLPVYAETYTDPTNPFNKGYVNTTCQFPQITIGGVLDAEQHGRDLWGVYGEKLGLLPKQPGASTFFRSSESALTQDTAGGVLRGIWPSFKGSVPLHQQNSAVDTVNSGYSCAARSSVLADLEATPAWLQQLNETKSLIANLSSILGSLPSAWTETFDHLNDNFQARLCNGYQLPCDVNDTSVCVSQEQADEVFRAGDWEWNYYWREYVNSTLYIQLTEGLFIGEILAQIQGVVNGTSPLKFAHTFVHDGDVGPIAGALGINQLRWPGMGSNIAMEIWRVQGSTNSPYYARVLYSGQPIETIHGTLDWIPLSQLYSILQPFVPENIIAMCNMA